MPIDSSKVKQGDVIAKIVSLGDLGNVVVFGVVAKKDRDLITAHLEDGTSGVFFSDELCQHLTEDQKEIYQVEDDDLVY